jgi:predicted RNase H-like HicB family nuclease
MKVTVIIEQNSKGRYSAYISDERVKFGVLGEGNTAEETIEDFKIGYEDIKESYLNEGKEFTELEFDFKYDTASFLSYYSNVMSLAGLSRITGINQGLLSHYVTGRKKPRGETILKIKRSVNDFGKKLSQVDFV